MEFKTFSQLSGNQLSSVWELFLQPYAYGILSSTHRYSFTELKIESKNNPDHKQELAVVEEGSVIGCIRLERKDWIARSLRVAVGMIQHSAGLPSFLRSFLDSLTAYEGLDRFYAYVLPSEKTHQGLLLDLGFKKEACLDEHVYHQGIYQDLEIWGTARKQR